MKNCNRHCWSVSLCLMFSFSLFLASCDRDSLNGIDSSIANCAGTSLDTTTYYVSTSGDDENDGKSESGAFRSLLKAFNNVLPGGTIRILPGTYNESISIEGCGQSVGIITVEGYKGRPVLDGKNEMTYSIFCENCMNYTFQNLKIQNYTDMGIAVSQSTGIVMKDLIVAENGHAVRLKSWELEGYGIHVETSQGVDISDNIVYRNGPEPKIIPDFIMGTGINTFGNRDVLIRNNKCYRNIGGGILVEDSYEVLVDSNEVYENDLDASVDEWWDGGLWLDGGGNVTVRANYFHDNLGPGIEVSDEDKQNPRGYVLENNVCTGNYYGIFIWNFGSNDWPSADVIAHSGNNFTGNSRQNVWIVDWLE